MSDKKIEHSSENSLRIGTPECAILCAEIAMVMALVYMLVGFWRAVLVGVLMLLGAFIGGVKNKKQWIREKINRLFPTPKPYREDNEAIVKAVREAIGKKNAKDNEEEPRE